jgi:hypothetical protein
VCAASNQQGSDTGLNAAQLGDSSRVKEQSRGIVGLCCKSATLGRPGSAMIKNLERTCKDNGGSRRDEEHDPCHSNEPQPVQQLNVSPSACMLSAPCRFPLKVLLHRLYLLQESPHTELVRCHMAFVRPCQLLRNLFCNFHIDSNNVLNFILKFTLPLFIIDETDLPDRAQRGSSTSSLQSRQARRATLLPP